MKFFTVKRNDCELSCRMRGSGEPLILIHGVASDAGYFDAAAEILAKSFSIITYDRRGYSESRADENADYSVRVQAEDAAEVIKAAGFESAYAAGCSAGGLVALEMGFSYPEKVKKIILHEPPLGMSGEDRAAIGQWLAELEDDAQKHRLTKAMIHFFKAIGGTDPSVPSLVLEQQVKNLENMKIFLYHELYEFLTYHKRVNGREKPDVSVTIAAGKEDVKGIFSGAAIRTAGIMGFDLMTVPGYHNLPNERPEAFAEVIKEWI